MIATPAETIEQAAGLIASLRAEIEILSERLDRGWRIIDERDAAGVDTTQLEAHFESLLAEYESACDRLRALLD